MNKDYIGIFDSGIGGLTVVKELITLLEKENIVYLGDTLNMPYGSKTVDQINQFAKNNITFLKQYNCKAYIVACGTMDSNARNTIDNLTDKMVIGVIEPSCLKAVKTTKNKKIGIIATSATIKTNAYTNKIKELDSTIEVYANDCPNLARNIEDGKFNSEDTKQLLQKYLKPLIDNDIDTLILGCTHYPLAIELITDIAKNVNIISCSYEASAAMKQYLIENNLLSDELIDRKYFVTGDSKEFKKTAKVFMNNIDEQIFKTSL